MEASENQHVEELSNGGRGFIRSHTDGHDVLIYTVPPEKGTPIIHVYVTQWNNFVSYGDQNSPSQACIPTTAGMLLRYNGQPIQPHELRDNHLHLIHDMFAEMLDKQYRVSHLVLTAGRGDYQQYPKERGPLPLLEIAYQKAYKREGTPNLYYQKP